MTAQRREPTARGRAPRSALPDQVGHAVRPRRSASVHAVDDVCLHAARGRDARHRGRVRLRQVDPLPDASCGCSSRRRARCSSAARTSRGLGAARAAPDAPRDADGLPGSLRVAEPAQARRARSSATPLRPARPGRRHATSAPRSRELLEPASDCSPSTPTATRTSSPAASASGSASPARSRCEPKLIIARRAGLRARRLDPGPDHQPARGPAGRVRPLLHLRRARPRRSCATSPTGSRSCTSARSSSAPRRDELYAQADPSLLGRPALRHADPRPEGERARASRSSSRASPQPGRSAVRLPLPHPLPVGDRDLLRGRAAARRIRDRPGGRLSSPTKRRRQTDRRHRGGSG